MTLWHLGIAVVVLLLVNSQLTWWIIFSIGQARQRLELEREVLGLEARQWARLLSESPEAAPTDWPEELEIGRPSETPDGRPEVRLTGRLSGQVVRPTAPAWRELLAGYRRTIVMMASEGAFFALMLLVGLGLMWRTLRREVDLEKQHRNFLSAITHELKSPLASMRLALETVLRGRADGTASVRFLENALQDTERLQSLVQKVLEVTRYTATASGLVLRSGDLGACVEDAVEVFSRRATAVGADLDADVGEEVWARFDPEAFQIVISNLLENALKYGGTPPRIRVALKRDHSHAVLEVRDNGGGIQRDEVDLVFTKFWRSGDEMTRTTHGTGLGLYLVHEIVAGHGGRVVVSDTGSDGTTFRVTLPATPRGGEAA